MKTIEIKYKVKNDKGFSIEDIKKSNFSREDLLKFGNKGEIRLKTQRITGTNKYYVIYRGENKTLTYLEDTIKQAKEKISNLVDKHNLLEKETNVEKSSLVLDLEGDVRNKLAEADIKEYGEYLEDKRVIKYLKSVENNDDISLGAELYFLDSLKKIYSGKIYDLFLNKKFLQKYPAGTVLSALMKVRSIMIQEGLVNSVDLFVEHYKKIIPMYLNYNNDNPDAFKKYIKKTYL